MLTRKVTKNVLVIFVSAFFFFTGVVISRAASDTINGVCDTSDWLAKCAGGSICLYGSISGTGPWTWTCVGTSDGVPATGCTSGRNNPTHYASLHGDYGRATPDGHGNYFVNASIVRGYIENFRVFIPPGTSYSTVIEILEWNGQSAIARHKIPPTSIFGALANTTDIKLSNYVAADRYRQGDPEGYRNGRLAILGDGFADPYLSVADSGWFYVKVDANAFSPSYTHSVSISVNADIYNNWYNNSGSNSDGSINWAKDVEGVTTYVAPTQTSPTPTPTSTPTPTPTPTPITAPTGPDCAAETCKGNPCNSQNKLLDNPWISGTKTEGCATITATVEPSILTTPGSTFIKWTSTGASKVEAECFSGPIIIPRGGWFTSDAKCKESGLVKECTDKGYEFKTEKELTGTETCKFYPTNSVGGQQGTPLVITFEVKKASTTLTPTINIHCANYPDSKDFCPNGTIVTTGTDSYGCNIYKCEPVASACSNYPDSKDFCPIGTIIITGKDSDGCNLYKCDKTTPTPTPTSQQKACENNCEQDVCVSKFCKDNCGDLVRGTRVGC